MNNPAKTFPLDASASMPVLVALLVWVEVMACCLMHQTNTWRFRDIHLRVISYILHNEFQKYNFKITTTSPMG